MPLSPVVSQMLPVFITLLITAVVAAVTAPFWRKGSFPAGAAASAESADSIDLALEKETLLQALAELQADSALGRMAGEDATRLKDETERKLASVLARLDAVASMKNPDGNPVIRQDNRQFALTAGIGLTVLLGSTGLYSLSQYKIERGQQQAGGVGMEVGEPKVAADGADGSDGPGTNPPGINPAEMVARLEKRLAENPDDLQGQMMAGRSYMAMERWDDAKAAWRKAIELDPRNDMAHYSLAEVLIRTSPADDRAASEEALDHLDRALINQPQEPTFLWARGIVLIQMGRRTEAEAAWVEVYRAIPPNTPASDRVKEALEALRAGS